MIDRIYALLILLLVLGAPVGVALALTGDVLLTQGSNVLAGERMTVDLATGAAQVQGRVRSVLQPGSN